MADELKKITVLIDPELEDLIPGFLKKRAEDVQKLQRALNENDFETIRIIGHNMKGSGAGYGFDFISEVGKSVETASKNKNGREVLKAIDELSQYLENIELKVDR